MQKPESLKLNPIHAVTPQPQAAYGSQKLILLDASDISLAGSSLQQNYVLGGHVDRDPMNTSFAPDSEHVGVLMSGIQVSAATFIGHYPDLNAEATDGHHPTAIKGSRFVLVEGKGYRFQVMSFIGDPLTAYSQNDVGQGANLTGANFKQADLTGTDFTGCNLSRANFSEANLRGCTFTRANLTKANFNAADLSGTIFRGARLAGADFTSTVTSDATDLSYTYLVGARFYVLGGQKATYLGCFQGAIFTDGKQRLEAANADFSQISGLVDGQFYCYYKCDVALPAKVECISTNRFVEARESKSTTPTRQSADWGGETF